MHEMALADSIRTTLLSAAKKSALSEIVSVDLQIGGLSCVDAESLTLALKRTLEDTIAHACHIKIAHIPGVVACRHCNLHYETDDFYVTCPSCNQYGFTVLSGKQMKICSFEGI